MTDPKVEEIRARLADNPFRFSHNDVALLLTKLDEAEKARDAARAEVERRPQRDFVSAVIAERNAAEERERTLIAGVREAIQQADEAGEVNWEEDNYAAGAQSVAAILSRLLPSTPEEGKSHE